MTNEAVAVRERLLRINEVIARVGLRTTAIYKRIRSGDFPKGVRLGSRSVAWPESEIDRWVSDRIKEARGS